MDIDNDFGIALSAGDDAGVTRCSDEYRGISRYLVRILAPVFVVGVATGLLMPFMIGTGLLGAFLLWKKKLVDARWFLAILPFLTPIPVIASELGWVGAEMGRQPWTVWGVLKTAEAATPTVQAGSVIATLFLTVSCTHIHSHAASLWFCAGAAALAAILGVFTDAIGASRRIALTSLIILGWWGALACLQWPILIRSTGPGPSLSVFAAASSPRALRTMVVLSVIAFPIIGCFTWYVYRVFGKPVGKLQDNKTDQDSK